MSRIAPESEGLQYAGVNYDSSPEALPYQPPQPQYYPLPMYKVEEHEEPYVAPAPSPPVTICGMRRNYFFFLAALAGFIVVAGAVVGGVVGSRQSSNSSVSSPSSTPTAATGSISTDMRTSTTTRTTSSSSTKTSTTSTSAFPTNTVLPYKCTNNGATYSNTPAGSSTQYSFFISCGRNYSPGSDHDIVLVKAYTLEECADSCAAYDAISPSRVCKGVVFVTNLTAVFQDAKLAGNCFLKDSMLNPSEDSGSGGGALLLSPSL